MQAALQRYIGIRKTSNLLGSCSRRTFFKHGVYRPTGATESPERVPPLPKAFYDASKIAMAKQFKFVREDRSKRRKVASGAILPKEGTREEILQIEADELIAKHLKPRDRVDQVLSVENSEPQIPTSSGSESRIKAIANNAKPSTQAAEQMELTVLELSSTGDGLALSEDGKEVYIVPFTIPGDKVLAKPYPYPQAREGPYTHLDFIKVIEPSASRDDSLVKCKYFGECAGCQLQMLPYESQLAHKKTIVEKAFRQFSGLTSNQIPAVADTIGSPMQYNYRTKLSPHFDGPGRRKDSRFTEVPLVGFSMKGRQKVMDIESCPIGTDILQDGLTSERAKVARDFKKYKNGATILLRESTEREPISVTTSTSQDSSSDVRGAGTEPIPLNTALDTKKDLLSAHVPAGRPITGVDEYTPPISEEHTTTSSGAPLIRLTTSTHIDNKTCITDNNGYTTEYISSFKFTSRAGSFFQNNNSILPRFTSYVRTHAFPPILNPHDPPIKYMLDAYCGSGLFAVTLSSLFTSVLGIDIDPKGVEAARINARENAIPNAGFIEADASALFADVPYPPAQTLVVIDPPRKGASGDFLQQLMRFGPKRVIYVSCNVHTQARDIGILVNGKGQEGWKYEIESLRGFDFFPQTGHVEGVAFLNRMERAV